MGEHKHPFAYGQIEPEEDLPETATAIHRGGNWSKSIDDTRKAAIEAFWISQHTGQAGPSFVSCKELDLHELPRKFGEGLKRPIAFEIGFLTYIIDKQPVAA